MSDRDSNVIIIHRHPLASCLFWTVCSAIPLVPVAVALSLALSSRSYALAGWLGFVEVVGWGWLAYWIFSYAKAVRISDDGIDIHFVGRKNRRMASSGCGAFEIQATGSHGSNRWDLVLKNGTSFMQLERFRSKQEASDRLERIQTLTQTRPA